MSSTRLATFISALLFVSRVASAQAPAQKVSISMSSTGMPWIELFIAREKGFFREEGFDPQLIRMSANAAIAAGIAGELDALGSIGSAVRGILRGAPIRVICGHLRRPIFWLVSRGESARRKSSKERTSGSRRSTAASTPPRAKCSRSTASTRTRSSRSCKSATKARSCKRW